MSLDESELETFRKWLTRRGRLAGTANAYVYHVRRAYAGGDPLEPVLDASSAPKTRRTIASALKAFAAHRGDVELLREIADVRLPPARRQKDKPPLTRTEWDRLRGAIDDADDLSPPLRGALGLIATRGFRRGDVLRLRPQDIRSALETGTLVYSAKGSRLLSFPVGKQWKSYLAECRTRYPSVAEAIAAGRQASGAPKLVTRALSLCAKRARIKKSISPHLLRHTYATFYYDLCRDPVQLKDHMQWASIETAMLYVAASNQKELEAVATRLFEE